MSKKNDGGPAFPFGVKVIVREGYGEGERVHEMNESGMSLRDSFAQAALPAVAAEIYSWNREIDGASIPELTAKISYAFADAMIAERAK